MIFKLDTLVVIDIIGCIISGWNALRHPDKAFQIAYAISASLWLTAVICNLVYL